MIKRKTICVHLGEPTGETIACSTCPGAVKNKVFACAHDAHETTHRGICETCPDYQAKDVPAPSLAIAAPVDDRPPCTCTAESLAAATPPLWCERMKRRMTSGLHSLCRDRPDQRELMECLAAKLPAIPPQRRLECTRLGAVLDQRGSACKARWVRSCELHGQCTLNDHPTVELRSCTDCSDYHPRLAVAPPTALVRVGDPACGVVIGSFLFPKLAELQIRMIRHHCGPVPILISDDCTPGKREEFLRLQDIYPDVTVQSSRKRIGHSGGDMSAFYWGLLWAVQRGLRVLAKLSQRFLIDRPYWLQDGAQSLLASGHTLATQRCLECPPIRTEACLLDVAAWGAPAITALLTPRKINQDSERMIGDVLKKLGGTYYPWAVMVPERTGRVNGVLFHMSHRMEEYYAVADRFGVLLDDEFTTVGWDVMAHRGVIEHVHG